MTLLIDLSTSTFLYDICFLFLKQSLTILQHALPFRKAGRRSRRIVFAICLIFRSPARERP